MFAERVVGGLNVTFLHLGLVSSGSARSREGEGIRGSSWGVRGKMQMFGTLVDAAYHLYLPLKVCILHDFGWFWGTLIGAICHLYLALKIPCCIVF